MQISDTGLNLIKQYEGLRLEAYYCPAGKLTVGYGHLVPGWRVGTLITEAEADDFLRMDVQGTEKAVGTSGVIGRQGMVKVQGDR